MTAVLIYQTVACACQKQDFHDVAHFLVNEISDEIQA